MIDIEIVNVEYSFEDGVHTTVLYYSDDSRTHIFIERGMIYVAEFDRVELDRRALAADLDSYEAYDTTDGCAYYLQSKHSTEISDSLIHLINTQIFCTAEEREASNEI